jgi:hypothetical protein
MDQRNRTRAEALGEQSAEVAQREEEADRVLETILAIEGDARYLRSNSTGDCVRRKSWLLGRATDERHGP